MKLDALKLHKPQNLAEIFANDEFGLFANIKPKAQTNVSFTLLNNFREIEAFVEKHNREPQNSATAPMSEKQLARRLKSMRENTENCKTLAEYDRLQLLDKSISIEPPKVINTLEDIFQSDEFGLLEIGDTSILDLVHVQPSQTPVNHYEGELTGSRTSCENFEIYQPVFALLHSRLKDKLIITDRQKSEDIKKGDIFILQGLLCIVVDKQEEARQSERKNSRLQIIFENKTKSNMLARSLYSILRKDEMSKKILFRSEKDTQYYHSLLFGKKTGYIYIVKLQSPKLELAQYHHLYKIGFTSTTVEERICNCENDVAFLESAVIPVMAFECYSLNPHKLETLLHEFLHAQKVKLTLISKNGRSYQPSEWFNVELNVIESIVEKLLDGTISQYRMNNISGKLTTKNNINKEIFN